VEEVEKSGIRGEILAAHSHAIRSTGGGGLGSASGVTFIGK